MDVRPRLFVSRCLGFDHCRWNGDMITNEAVEILKEHADIITACPESAIGLGVPRKPIRIVRRGEQDRLEQPATKRDITAEMRSYIETIIPTLDVDGIILKYGSPTCGLANVKIYPPDASWPVLGKRGGFFGSALQNTQKGIAIIDEGRLTNFDLRSAFQTQVWTQARFRTISSPKGLVAFQSEHKFIFKSFSPEKTADLGRIIASQKERQFRDVLSDCQSLIHEIFSDKQTKGKIINVLMHCFGFISKDLSSGERDHFLQALEDYRASLVPLSSLLMLMQSWTQRFKISYLADQRFFDPFPKELVTVRDSGKTC